MEKVVTGKIAFKEDWNIIVLKGAYLHILHEDDFEYNFFKKLKIGDKITAPSWHKIKISTLSQILKSNKKKTISRDYRKPLVYLDAPIKIKHKTYSFGGLPDGTIINGYVLASKGGQHLIYCAKDCFYDDSIDSGCGSICICVKQGNFYHCKYKDARILRGWRNVGEESVANFYNRFVDGKLHDVEYEAGPKAIKEAQLLRIFRKIDAVELAEAKKQLKAYKKTLIGEI